MLKKIKSNRVNFSNHKLYDSKLMLSEEFKLTSINSLKKVLVNIMNFRLILKTAHWNIKCKSFYSLHTMFDDLQEKVDTMSDEIAEQIVALAGKTNTSLDEMNETILDKQCIIDSDSTKYISAVIKNLVILINLCRNEMLLLEEDEVTSNYLQELILRLHKILYFLESHIQT
jgi:starvation-inducible DNA-binding protein